MKFKLILFFLAFSAIGFIILTPLLTYAQVGPPAPPVEKGVTITVEVPAPPFLYATVVFKGKAYPLAFVTVLKDGSVVSTFEAQNNGYFSKTITGLSGGIYTFGIWAEDTEGRKSITLDFTVTLAAGTTTTISGIFLPPTIEIEKTKLRKGEILKYQGQAYSLSGITIFIDPGSVTKKASATNSGKWQYLLDTSFLERGAHTTKVKAQTDGGEQSTFSETLSFEITHPCPGADLNQDGKVNLTDFSIMLYWWGSDDECTDQNSDGTVSLIDFSIMLYYWTG